MFQSQIRPETSRETDTTHISRHLDGKLIKLSVTKKNSYLHVRTGLRKQKIGDYKIFTFFAKFSS